MVEEENPPRRKEIIKMPLERIKRGKWDFMDIPFIVINDQHRIKKISEKS
jgi:hypothetical protein